MLPWQLKIKNVFMIKRLDALPVINMPCSKEEMASKLVLYIGDYQEVQVADICLMMIMILRSYSIMMCISL